MRITVFIFGMMALASFANADQVHGYATVGSCRSWVEITAGEKARLLQEAAQSAAAFAHDRCNSMSTGNRANIRESKFESSYCIREMGTDTTVAQISAHYICETPRPATQGCNPIKYGCCPDGHGGGMLCF